MEQHQLESKCFSRGGDLSRPCTQEFTVSLKGRVPWGILSLGAAVLGVSVQTYHEQWTSSTRDVVVVGALAVVFLLYLASYMTSVSKETLLLVMPLGLQMTTATRSGNQDTTWIPWCLLGNFMILDVIVGQKVIFCLAVSVKDRVDGKEKTLILFRNTKPRLHQLETIYRELQTSLDKYR